MTIFSEKLYKLRKSRGWSQEQLAEQIDVSRQTISKWESGTNRPDLDKLRQLSLIFEVTLDELVNEEKIPAVSSAQRTLDQTVESAPGTQKRKSARLIFVIAGIVLIVIIAAVTLFTIFNKPEEASPETNEYEFVIDDSDYEWTNMDELRYHIQAMIWSEAVLQTDLGDITPDAIWARLEYEGIADQFTEAEIEQCIRFAFIQYFELFEYYGLNYYADEHRLYYNGERVSYFEDDSQETFATIIWSFDDGDVEVNTADFVD